MDRLPLHSLVVVPYDPDWPGAFAAEAARLAVALGALALRIDHHGSTAVPGLGAKPIIDIQISVAAVAPLDVFADRLGRLGYRHLPHPDDWFCPFFHRPHEWPHTHHLHLVDHGGAEEQRTLAFRDYLRDHDAAAREYERVKRALAAETNAGDPVARETYAAAKSAFIERTIAVALASGYPHTPSG